jgi:hypothetical protein
MTESDDRLLAIERRLLELEDQIAIYQLMSSYGPLVDSGDADAASELWIEDGVYDWGGGTPVPGAPPKQGVDGSAYGRAAIADMVRGPLTQESILNGAAHVAGFPHVALDGDRAVAITYSRLYRYDVDNFRVWRVAANRWEFVRTPEGWRVSSRVNRGLNGSEEARALLRSGIGS